MVNLNLSSRNSMCILIIIISLVCITMADNKKRQLVHKRNHQDGLRRPVLSNNPRIINRKKRSNSISTVKPFFYLPSNINSINTSASPERLKNTNVPVQIKDNDNSLEDLKKLFGTMNKHSSNEITSPKSEILNLKTIHTKVEQKNPEWNQAPVFPLVSCKYLCDLTRSFAAKLVALEKSQVPIDKVSKIDSEKRLKRHTEYDINVTDANDDDNGDDEDDESEELEMIPTRNPDDDSDLKTELVDIYPDTLKDTVEQLPLVKLIRTKRFGDAGRELKDERAVVDTNGRKSGAKYGEDLRPEDPIDYFNVSVLLHNLQDLAENIVDEIAVARESMEQSPSIVKRHEEDSLDSSSVINSLENKSKITSSRQC